METQPVNNISNRALLVTLSLSMWTARKHDRKASAEIAIAHESSEKMGRYWKRLLPTDAASYEECKRLRSECRDWHYHNTLPWTQDGQQILPSANYFAYTEQMRKYRAQIEAADAAFYDDYPALRENAKQLLKSLWSELDYPSVDILRSKCRMDINFMPMPDAQDFRVALGDGEVDRIRKDIEQQVHEATEIAMRDIWQRLYDAVSRMSQRLNDPDGIFRNSLVGNVRELCDLLPRLNIAQDHVLDALVKEVEDKLSKADADDLRDDDKLRKSIAKQAAAIEKKMAAFMGGAK